MYKPVRCECEPASVFSVILLDVGAAVVEQVEPRSAVSRSADRDSGLLQHLVQGGFLYGC